jgi:hypothetical protein
MYLALMKHFTYADTMDFTEAHTHPSNIPTATIPSQICLCSPHTKYCRNSHTRIMYLWPEQPGHKPNSRTSFILDAHADTAFPCPSTLRERIAESRLHHILTLDQPRVIEVASDGGAREDLGSSGWEIEVQQEIIWQCKGATFGLMPGSFRAESYGMLSALLFLDTYCK